MRARLVCMLAFALGLLSVLVLSPPAWAAELRPPVPGGVLLAFGVRYGEHVHSGLDLAAPEGSSVVAPADGTVSFAGRLPGGNGALGVTVTTPDGLKVTCSPLASAAVAKGAEVAAGETLGAVAAEGDASSSESHVHLSVRDGDTYLDPAKLLPAVSAPVPVPTPVPGSAVEPAPDNVPAPAPTPIAPVAPGAPCPAPSPAPAPSAGAAPAAAPIPAPSVPVAHQTAVGQHSPSLTPAASLGRAGVAGVVAPAASAAVPSAVSLSAASVPVVSSAALAQGAGVIPRASGASAHASTARTVPAAARPLPSVAPAATPFARVSAAVGRARSLVTDAAALMAALALMWPVWRRMSRPVEIVGEPAPVRASA